MKRLIPMALAGLVLSAACALAGDAKDERDFLTRASNANLTASAEAQLALDRAADPQIKAFAQQLADAHAAAEPELKAAAEGSGAAVPATPDAAHQARITALHDKSGVDFDRAFIAEQAEIHSNALTLYADYMLLGDNAKLKALAIKMIPITEAQFKAAQKLSSP